MNFYETLTKAVNEMLEHGFDSPERLLYWMEQIKLSAVKALIPESQIKKELDRSLRNAFDRLVTKGALVSPNVSAFTLQKLKPKLREELDRRIMASANLITYNREQSVAEVLRRFEGWATSIPKGGRKMGDKLKEKQAIRKSLANAPFEQRRVVIDQTHKLIANIHEIVAKDTGAIAAVWHSHWKQINYDYRKDHKERDQKIYVIRGSWADEQKLLKPAHGYTDQITAPGEEVFCRCNYVYLYGLSQCKELLTKKGKLALQSAHTI